MAIRRICRSQSFLTALLIKLFRLTRVYDFRLRYQPDRVQPTEADKTMVNGSRALGKFVSITLAAALLSFAASAARATQTSTTTAEIPKTPAGEQFSAWFSAFNSADRAQLESFRSHFDKPEEHKLEGMLDFRQQTGGFELKKIEESGSTKLTALVQERDSDQFARLSIEVEAAAAHRVTHLEVRAISRPAEFALSRLSQSDLIAVLRAKLEKDTAAGKFSGAALLAKDGKAVFTGVYGLADRERKIPSTLNTKFRIGSMNKMFTAVAILQLVQAGKISLNDLVGKYLTDYPNKDIATRVTVYQLLTHTGGTGDFFGPQFDAHRLELKTLRDYVKLYGERAPEFEPGSRWEYSNYGFLMLGLIVERVSGKNYYDYVNENIYGPAGMTSTGSFPEDQVVPDRSIGYTQFDGEALRPNTDTLPYRGTSAGGGYCTVEDFLRFANALINHKLLTSQSTDLLTTGKVDTPTGAKYAFGFMDLDPGTSLRHFGHGGGAPGMNGDLQIFPQTGYVIVVLSNLDPPAASRISDFIVNRLPAN
jgi:D-alanyl-D-alanine carboxypeptidase